MAPRAFKNWVLNKFGAIRETEKSPDKPLIDNTDHFARFLYRFQVYGKMAWFMMRNGVPLPDIIRSQFPLIKERPRAPLMVTLEITNHCNLECVYCTSRLGLRPRGFIEGDVLKRFVEDTQSLGVSWVNICGNGEPTLHPEFAWILGELAQAAPYLTALTNGQREKPGETIQALIAAPVSMVEVSVNGATKADYEASRVGGSFERLIGNLTLLKKTKRDLRSRMLTRIRLMVRPSDRTKEKQMRAFWRRYADVVMPECLVERHDLPYVEDLYRPIQYDDESYPRCSLLFKSINMDWNGDVPLCFFSAQQIGSPGLILGNLRTDTLGELWNGPVMRQYREAQRTRNVSDMPVCKGCSGI